jgi:hypothetical protein
VTIAAAVRLRNPGDERQQHVEIERPGETPGEPEGMQSPAANAAASDRGDDIRNEDVQVVNCPGTIGRFADQIAVDGEQVSESHAQAQLIQA